MRNGKEKAMHAGLVCVAMVFLVFAVSGCASVAGKVAGAIAKPVLGLAVKDARTTLAWVDREEAAGRLGSATAKRARRCPEAVLALDALRTQLTSDVEDEEGFRGLIYYGTLNKFSKGVQSEAAGHLEALAASCIPLVPAEKLIRVF